MSGRIAELYCFTREAATKHYRPLSIINMVCKLFMMMVRDNK